MTLPVGLNGTQWGVGHGGFHTQSITLGDPPGDYQFRLIYDCGSLKPHDRLRTAIDAYADGLPIGANVDLLVISHFDFDHVSGLEHLADALTARSVRIKRVYVPFLTPLETIALAVGGGASGGTDPDDWYLAFLADPIGVLGDLFDSAQVLQLRPEDYTQPDADEEYVVDEDLRTDEGEPIVERGHRTARLRVEAPGSVPVWELVPYARDDVQADADSYYAELQKGLPPGALPAGGVGGLTNVDIVTLVTRHRKVLNKACRALKHAPNKTSVCLYSGPTDHVTAQRAWSRNVRAHQGSGAATGNAWYLNGGSNAAWLATGDAELGASTAVRQFAGFYGDRLGRVRILGVPHHGSRGNSCDAFWDSMPGLLIATLHSNGVRYRHPSREVLVAALQRAVRPVLVDDKHLSFEINHKAP